MYYKNIFIYDGILVDIWKPQSKIKERCIVLIDDKYHLIDCFW